MEDLLTDEQKMLKEMVEGFAEDKVKPLARENDQSKRFPKELIEEASGLGLLGIPYPEKYGGSGMDFVSYMIALEAISRYCASTGVIISAHTSLSIDPIFRFGTEKQKQRFMPDLCNGKKLGCFCLTESQAGSDVSSLKTTATHNGDKWILNGSKQFITNAPHADTAIVFAVTDPGKGNKGISAFIVKRDTPGYSVGKQEHKLGINASSLAAVHFDQCVIPEENLLGEINGGFKIAMVTLDGGRVGIAAQALGIARAAILDSITYAKDRNQFGQAIANFQGIKWYLAEMWTEYEAAWLLTYHSAKLKDLGKSHTRESAMAKWKASEVCEFCASKAIQIHGGYGYTKEYNPERYFRDAKITQIYEGTSEIQKEIIAASLLKQF